MVKVVINICYIKDKNTKQIFHQQFWKYLKVCDGLVFNDIEMISEIKTATNFTYY